MKVRKHCVVMELQNFKQNMLSYLYREHRQMVKYSSYNYHKNTLPEFLQKPLGQFLGG